MEWCRRGESNPRPRDYETLALPLSYAGTMPNHGKESYAKVSSNTKEKKSIFPRVFIISSYSGHCRIEQRFRRSSTSVPLTTHAPKTILIAGKLELTGSPGGENPLAGQGARVYTV